MHTKSDLIRHIQSAGINPNDTLLVHSSMKALGCVQGGADTVLDAFSQCLSQGLLVFPTHTWEQINSNYCIFDPCTEPSCVGILSELFRQRPGVIRSWHPTHSVAALGKDAGAFTAGEEHCESPLPRHGCWGRLYDRDAKILFLGAPLTTNTILHGVEEWNKVPHRLKTTPQQLQIRTPDGRLLNRPMRRHDAPVDVSSHYGKIQGPLLELGIATAVRIGDAASILCQVRPMVDLVSSLLKRNPDLFLDDAAVPAEWYNEGPLDA